MKHSAKIAIYNSILSIVLCLVLITNATMAIFTSKSDINIAVTSGSVRVVATPSLDEASSAEWDDITNDYIYPPLEVKGNKATFATGGTASIDGDGRVILDKIMPGDSATVKIEIKNLSTIDIKYQLTATFGNDSALLNILDISLTCEENTALEIFDTQFKHTGTFDGADKASKWQSLSAPADSADPTAATLFLKISFPMDLSLEAATYAGKSASIALAVNAVQGNAHTEDPEEPETNEVVPDNASYTIGRSDEGRYKILNALQVEGYEFLYWAVEKSASGISRTAARTGAITEFGEYLTNQPVYKFRVTPQTYGTYHAVYRNVKDTSKLIRLTKASPEFTVQQSDVGSAITLIAEAELWDTFEGFTREKDGSSDNLAGNELSMYTFTPTEADVGAIYKAKYVELDLETYADYFDNTGAVNYEATIINENVPRNIPEDYGCGGIDESNPLDDYPIYNKGYAKGFNSKLNEKVVAENDALSTIGSKYFMDKDGILYDYAQFDPNDMEKLYQFMEETAKSFCIEYQNKYPELSELFDEDGEFNYDRFNELWYGDPSPSWYSDYTFDVLAPAYDNMGIWTPVGHLYKHKEAENLYLGNVDDNQPAVEKVISATPRGSKRNSSPTITGLYAPAGEVITFKISKEVMERTGGLIITIGMVQLNGTRRALDINGNPLRPHYLTTPITLTAKMMHPSEVPITDEEGNYVFYFGSYIGGPIYVSPYNGGEPFTVDISGAVEYQHYIYGYTSKEEFEARADYVTNVPYFELAVATEDVRFTGPSYYAKGLDWTNFTKVSRFWEQIARISKQFPGDNFNEYGVMFNYDLYILGGAGAFTAINTVNAVHGWMGGALNYENLVKYGNWGNIHELNHCYQLFGWRDPEVSNNAINLVELAMLTEVSAARQRDAEGKLSGVSGWSSYTDPAYALLVSVDPENKTGLLNGSQDRNLCRYANIFYGFGIDRFVESMHRTASYGLTAYNIAWITSEGCGYDMQYYFKNVLGYNVGSPNNINGIYPMFVPVASPYQIGVGHAYDPTTGIGVDATTNTEGVQWEYTHSSSPYRIDMSQNFTLDFEQTLALPGRERDENGKMTDTQFDWSIELTEESVYGEIISANDGGKHFTYHPNEEARKAGTSGRMVFTVTYMGKEGTAAANIQGSVQIVVQFDQMPGTMPDYDHLDRTVYTYNVENVDSGEEEESGEAAAIAEGTEETPKTSEELFNAAKAAWLEDPNSSDGTFPDAMYMTTEQNTLPEGKKNENNTAVYFDELNSAPQNSFIVVSGIYTPKEGGTYYLGLESFGNSALYISEDGTNYHLHAACGPNVTTNAADAINGSVGGGLCRAAKKITLTADAPIYFREVLAPNPDDPNNDHVKMLWGEDSIKSISELTDTPEGSDHDGCAYCLRETAAEPYELEYWTDRDEIHFEAIEVTQTPLEDEDTVLKRSNLQKPSYLSISGYEKEPLDLGNLFNENPYDFFAVNGVKDSAPLKFTVQLGEKITADSFIIHAYPDYAPTKFKLYVGNSEEEANNANATPIYEQSVPNSVNKTGTIKASFKDGQQTFSYYRLEIYQTVRARDSAGYFLVLNGIEFGTRWNVKQPSDRDVEKLGAWDNVRTNDSTFGYLLTAKGATENAPVSTLTMKFTGTQLHIRALKGQEYGAVEILIDGKSVADIDLRDTEMGWVDILSTDFLSEEDLEKISDALSSGNEHTLVLRSTEKFNVDAIYYR